jgi:hypothetical protein
LFEPCIIKFSSLFGGLKDKVKSIGVTVGLEVVFTIGVDFGVLVNSYPTTEVNKTATKMRVIATLLFIDACQLREYLKSKTDKRLFVNIS